MTSKNKYYVFLLLPLVLLGTSCTQSWENILRKSGYYNESYGHPSLETYRDWYRMTQLYKVDRNPKYKKEIERYERIIGISGDGSSETGK